MWNVVYETLDMIKFYINERLMTWYLKMLHFNCIRPFYMIGYSFGLYFILRRLGIIICSIIFWLFHYDTTKCMYKVRKKHSLDFVGRFWSLDAFVPPCWGISIKKKMKWIVFSITSSCSHVHNKDKSDRQSRGTCVYLFLRCRYRHVGSGDSADLTSYVNDINERLRPTSGASPRTYSYQQPTEVSCFCGKLGEILKFYWQIKPRFVLYCTNVPQC